MTRLTLRRPRRVFLPSLQHPRVQPNPYVHRPLDPTTLPETEPTRAELRTVRAMLNAWWPVLIATLSFLFTTNLSDLIFVDVLGALQTLAPTAGCPRTSYHM